MIAIPVLADPVPVRSELLATVKEVRHALTGRVEGMGMADGNVGYSAPRDRADAWAMRQQWCALSGFDVTCLVTLGQIHGTDVQIAAAGHAGWGAMPGSRQIGLGDVLITAEPGPVLMTLHADCQPILVVDPGSARRGPVVAAIHAGWRGTVDDIVGRTIEVMREAYGSKAADVQVFLGPAIGVCCYEVGDEVVSAWSGRAGSGAGAALSPGNGRSHFSLAAANALLLERAGVRAAQIEQSPICTRCNGDHWFSHRGQGADTGRFAALIAIDPK